MRKKRDTIIVGEHQRNIIVKFSNGWDITKGYKLHIKKMAWLLHYGRWGRFLRHYPVFAGAKYPTPLHRPQPISMLHYCMIDLPVKIK
jgi:hypothetical protein